MKEHLYSPTGISVSSGNLEDLPSLPRDMMQRRDLSVKSVKMQRHDGDRSLRSSIQECYLEILSLFFLAVLVSCMNHVLFAHFDGQEPGSHTSQFWVTVLKNMFPAAVAFLLFMGLKICLSQVALYHIQLSSHPIGVVNFMTSPPGLLNILSTLLKSSMHASIISFALLTAITQAVALTSLFVPGTLTVVPSPPRTQTLVVPTIDFNFVSPTTSVIDVARTGDDDQLGISTSQRWQQLIQRAASSNSAPGWNPPAGCGSSCSYTFSYFAPALNCTQLSKQDIWPSRVNTSDSLLTLSPTSGTFFNSTPTFAYTSSEKGSPFNRGLNVVYMENFNSTRETASLLFSGVVLDPQQWSPQGVKCIYQNATYEAETTFSNNTQLSSTRVKEWNGAFSFSFNTTNIAVASLSLVESFISLVMGTAYMLPSNRNFVLKTDVTSNTVLFNITGNQTNSTNTFFSFSLNSMLEGNLSAGLQDLFGNVTLAFVNERMTTTFTDAAVTPNSTEYQYIGWRLALIYGIVFGFSLVVITYGLFCLQKNGTVATFDLKHILEMTARSTSLHESAAQPEFDSTLVKGTLSPVSEGNRHRLVVLEVSD